MILAFADDSTVCVFDTIAQANSYCEAIDVENHIFVFVDDRGFVLKPVFTRPPEKKKFLFVTTISSGEFTLQQTDDKREDLLEKLESGEITIGRGPTGIRLLGDLRNAAPLLFRR